MKHSKGGVMLSYNPQVTVDSKCGIIVANEGDNKGDEKQLESQVLQAEETLDDLEDAKLLADNGYYEGKNLKFLFDKSIDAGASLAARIPAMGQNNTAMEGV